MLSGVGATVSFLLNTLIAAAPSRATVQRANESSSPLIMVVAAHGLAQRESGCGEKGDAGEQRASGTYLCLYLAFYENRS